MLKGSDDPSKKDFTTIKVGSGITLEGWSGIFIQHDNKKAYGILVNMDGTINAVNDTEGGTGIGIYVNGNISHKENPPVINLGKNAKITSTGNGIYAAGYSIYNIDGAYIEGKESGLGIKSGIFNINSGTIIGTGEDKTPTSGNNNGINASGTAIQIESNKGYAGNIELSIKNGNLTSNNSYVIYEYTTNNSQTQVKKIELKGGTYTSKAGKDALVFSDNFKSSNSDFITGGLYSSNPTNYLKNGYSATKNSNNFYEVTLSTINVFKEFNNNKSYTPIIITIICLLILGTILYLNRTRILNLLKK